MPVSPTKATELDTSTAPPERIPIGPEAQLYQITTDYHWPTFNANATDFTGDWNAATGIGYGPFGFGSSVKLDEGQVNTFPQYNVPAYVQAVRS